MIARFVASLRISRLAVTGLAAAGFWLAGGAAHAEPTAVVPTQVIYPGDAIEPSLLRVVEVTNPNVRTDYVSSLAELQGAVARRTLLPGRVIPVSAVREAYVLERGQPVRLVFSQSGLVISATGSPLQSAGIGDFIQVRNIETGVTVSGTVMADGTVRVITQ